MEVRKGVSKRRFGLLLLVPFAVLVLCLLIMVFGQPYVVYRFVTKIYANYEIYLLKYPNSHFVESEIRPTSKVTMATDYTYYTSDDIDSVRKYMDQQMPGFVHLQGVPMVNELTYSNSVCADETAFRYFFQVLGRGSPCIEVRIYPSDTNDTSITITENWISAGFPAWLRGL